MKKTVIILLLIIFQNCQSQNQADTTLFPGLIGQQLLDSLIANYTPVDVYRYAGGSEDVRDSLFRYIYNLGDDSLRCVYTGFTIKLDTLLDPSADAYTQGINTEHSYPQSKGADNYPPEGDMHHLFPVKANVNSSRSNHPYSDVLDINTDTWYWKDLSQSTIPTSSIEKYSEKFNDGEISRFEPREEHKGNAARAVFYFFTFYRSEALAADSNFFYLQKDNLKDWHYFDVADSLEFARNNRIEDFQGNMNPFILDSTLIRRTYFEGELNDTTIVLEQLSVFISEISDATNFNYEFIELYNNSNEAIDLTGIKLVRVDAATNSSEYVFDFGTDGSGSTQIDPFEILIIDRGGTQVDFENEWGISLGANVNFNTGSTSLYIGTGTARRWRLRTGGHSNTDDGELLDDTQQAVAGTSQRHYQDPVNIWNADNSTNATPGILEGNQDTSLPVALINFDASKSSNIIILSWKTASEIDNLGFEVYRSINCSDDFILLDSYKTNATLIGAGNTSAGNMYEYMNFINESNQQYYYKISDVHLNGTKTFHNPISIFTGDIDEHIAIKTDIVLDEFNLNQNYPNPFNPITNIDFSLPESKELYNIVITIYNSTGKKVKNLFSGLLSTGGYSITWDSTNEYGSKISTGTYYCTLKTPVFTDIIKMILIR